MDKWTNLKIYLRLGGKNEFNQNSVVIINLSGSGSKDLDIIKEHMEFRVK